jgi:predicted O-linked N-acetylglucosamine transferase (SPINDLY family)
LGRTIGDVVDRVHFVPRLGHVDFRHLCARADVLLDPIHFGGGHTSYEALALGTPIVTLPSPFLRGRITQALYRTMGVTECIASTEQEYIDLSVKLGTDPDRRAAVKGAILAENHRIFQDSGALRGLEDFFRAVV